MPDRSTPAQDFFDEKARHDTIGRIIEQIALRASISDDQRLEIRRALDSAYSMGRVNGIVEAKAIAAAGGML